MMQYFELFFRGFTTNILITACAAFWPLVLGILLSLFVKKSTVVSAIVDAVNIPLESISVPLAMMALFYTLGRFFHIGNLYVYTVIVVMALSLAYLFYMPTRYNEGYSFIKNILYNGLGLISWLFKWSFVASFVGVMDALGAARNLVARTYQFWPYTVVFLVAFGILFVIELLRFLVKKLIK